MKKVLTERIRALVTSQHVCVLATVDKDRPYCSLMNYVTDEKCCEFYMATLRNTKKYKNLLSEPLVSLLVDSREKTPSSNSCALTVEGVFETLSDAEKRDWALSRLVAQNPSLNEFVRQPDIEVLCIRARSFLLLTGIADAEYLNIV